MVNVLVTLSVILTTAFLINMFFKKIGFPPIIGQILAGMILGVPTLKVLLFSSESLLALDLLSTLGIVFLLILAGLEIDVRRIRDTTRDSILIALGTTLTPLLLGLAFLLGMGYNFTVGIVFGGALAVTAGGTIVGVLMDFNACNTKLGAIFVAAGTIDDILEIFLLSIIVTLIHGGNVIEMALLPVELLMFVLISFVLFKIISKILPKLKMRSEANGGNVEVFSFVVIFVIGMAALSELLEIGYLIGAVIAGFLLQLSMKRMGRRSEREVVSTTRLITLAFVVPFFFANVGLNFDLGVIFGNPVLTVAAVLIAVGGAILGALVTKPFSSLSFRQLYIVGWAMSSKGAVEMVIALLAQRYGLLPPEIFSAIVAMAIITTLAFPFILKKEIERNRSIMNA